MGLKQKLVNQIRKPSGKVGRIIARGMNKGHAKLAKWGLSKIVIEPNYIILDIGCGGGGNIKRFAEIIVDGKIYGIDYSETAVSVSKEVNKRYLENGTVEIYNASVSSLPFEDNFFDIISGFEAYYFWPDLPTDLKEIYRVLKPKGKIILVNEGYLCNNEKKRKKAQMWSELGKFPLHTPEEYNDLLTNAGFSNIQIFEENKKGWITIIGKKIRVI
ncbi:MAG: class I SAM-dependent methyltransferase [Promethearchaeota archaeon]